jgi:hypothetical protein
VTFFYFYTQIRKSITKHLPEQHPALGPAVVEVGQTVSLGSQHLSALSATKASATVISPHSPEQHLPSAPSAGHEPTSRSSPISLHSDGLELGVSEGLLLGLELGVTEGLELGVPEGLELGFSDGLRLGLELGIELGFPDGLELGLELGEWVLSTQVPTAFHALVQTPPLRAGAYAAWLHHPGTLHLKA